MKNEQKSTSNFMANKGEGICISSIVLAELEYGVCFSRATEKSRRKLISFLPLVDVLPFDGAAAVSYGEIHASLRRKGTLIGIPDMLIAAHAKALGMTIVTNNVREFERVEGLKIENWA
jgi:tRNA(fMet)-specific endonuclease VapC